LGAVDANVLREEVMSVLAGELPAALMRIVFRCIRPWDNPDLEGMEGKLALIAPDGSNLDVPVVNDMMLSDEGLNTMSTMGRLRDIAGIPRVGLAGGWDALLGRTAALEASTADLTAKVVALQAGAGPDPAQFHDQVRQAVVDVLPQVLPGALRTALEPFKADVLKLIADAQTFGEEQSS
jgi:hypothetical protein